MLKCLWCRRLPAWVHRRFDDFSDAELAEVMLEREASTANTPRLATLQSVQRHQDHVAHFSSVPSEMRWQLVQDEAREFAPRILHPERFLALSEVRHDTSSDHDEDHEEPSDDGSPDDFAEHEENVGLPGRPGIYTSVEAAVLMSLLPHEKWGWQYIRDEDNGEGDAECRVCLDEYVPDADIVRLPCMHYAHTRCMEEWLIRCPVCPVCRTDAREALGLSQW